MRARLDRAQLEPDACEAAISELTELGYLDDSRYARVFAEDKRNLEDWGSERIERVLLERGVDGRMVSEALAARAGAADSEQDRALALARRRFPVPSNDPRELERVLGMLIRKGYDSDLAYDAVRAWSRASE